MAVPVVAPLDPEMPPPAEIAIPSEENVMLPAGSAPKLAELIVVLNVTAAPTEVVAGMENVVKLVAAFATVMLPVLELVLKLVSPAYCA